MKIDILVDSEEFFQHLKNDIRNAQKNIYIQVMTFEADKAGKDLCELLMDSSVRDIRILIDSYIKAIISDCFIYSPKNVFNSSLKNEFVETFKLIDHLNDTDIQVRLTNPLGPLFIRLMGRNHKKMMIIDNKIAYLGGFNFSDHNFLWHDIMFRIEEQNIASFLEKDFLATWDGKNQCCEKDFNSLKFYILDGKTNEKVFESIFEMIEQAKHTIFIETAYLSFPFYEKLRQASERGISINYIAPENNNISIMQKYTYWEAERSHFQFRLFKNNMIHMKAMLIDDQFLVVGSSNFDYFSYTCYQELILVIQDLDIISEFKREVIHVDWNRSVPWTGKTSATIGLIHYLVLRTIFPTLKILSRINK